uniref:Uncharacterized protein n=1 Tax=Helicotheca tamesis TaxID=374047 RepID=A0A7S2H8Y4_9STRA
MLKEGWSRTYSPDGEITVMPSSLLYVSGSSSSEDVLLIAGSTSGSGAEFGAVDTDENDLDGFVSKMDPSSGQFMPGTFSFRIKSQSNKAEVVSSLCMKENSPGVKEFYVVGYTTGALDGVDSSGAEGFGKQAFIMKMNLDSLESPIWTQQLGPNNQSGDTFGIGCAVTPDGNDVYLSGIVTNGSGIQGTDKFSTTSEGGDDVFVAKYDAAYGKIQFLQQIGTSENESLARGGGITVDTEGNAILMGTTKGSLMRYRGKQNRERRTADAFFGHTYNTADVFVMSVSRESGEHRTPMERVVVGGEMSAPSLSTGIATNQSSGQHGSSVSAFHIIGVTMLIMLSCGVVVFTLFVGYKFYQKRVSDKDFLSHNVDLAKHLEDFEDVEVEIRHSATGGVHGMYHFDEAGKKDENIDKTTSFISATDPRLMSSRLLKESMFMDDDEEEKNYDLTMEAANTPDDLYDDDAIVNDDDDVDYNVGRMRRSNFRRGNKTRTASYRGLVDSYDTIWKDCAEIADSNDELKAPPKHAFQTMPMEETKPRGRNTPSPNRTEETDNFRIT